MFSLILTVKQERILKGVSINYNMRLKLKMFEENMENVEVVFEKS